MLKNLTLTPFEARDKESNTYIKTFLERGIVIDFIVFSENLQPNSGNLYKFGTTDKENNHYWFFNGKSLIKGRSKAIEVYKALIIYCKYNELEYPFLCKVFK